MHILPMHTFSTYEDWKFAITERCGLRLTEAYCVERVSALQNLQDEQTRAFRSSYGEAYCNQVIAWFQRALGEGNTPFD